MTNFFQVHEARRQQSAEVDIESRQRTCVIGEVAASMRVSENDLTIIHHL